MGREMRIALGVMGALVVVGVGISLALQPELVRRSGGGGVDWRSVLFIAAAVAVGVAAVVQGIVALAEWFGKQRIRSGLQPEITVEEDAMDKELASLRRQLAEMEESLRLIEERKAEYVLGVDIPLMLVKEERRLQDRIEDTKGKIRRLEVGAYADTGAPAGDKPATPIGGSSTATVGAPATLTNVNGESPAGSSKYHSCFISYSSRDEVFAEKLHRDLVGKGVECWFAPEDMRIGDKIRQRIDAEIRQHAKLLLILSVNSVTSDWVASEVEAAFEKERLTKTTVLFPIRLDDAVMTTQAAWAAEIRRTRHIGDFTKWQDAGAYDKGLKRLLRDLAK